MSSNKFYIRLSWLMLLIVALQFNLTSCNDDEMGVECLKSRQFAYPIRRKRIVPL